MTNNIPAYLILWLLLSALLFVESVRRGRAGVGLALAYIVNLTMIHWPGAMATALPWYYGNRPALVESGLLISLIALVAFAFGAFFLSPRLDRWKHLPDAAPAIPSDPATRRLPIVYLAIGLLSALVLQPLLGGIPSVNAALLGVAIVPVAALNLGIWRAHQAADRSAVYRWLALGLVFPVVTIVQQGFIGYGMLYLSMVATFFLTLTRPSRRLALMGLVVAYFFLSFFVTYFRDRGTIREAVWGQESVEERALAASTTVTKFEWFNIRDDDHLAALDGRLNQNWLIGVAMDYMRATRLEPSGGESVAGALVAFVPRLVWPDKPVLVGSSRLVMDYSGLFFSENTSVGPGQIMEFWINFGRWGVVIGMAVWGLLLGLMDRRAQRHLHAGNWPGFAQWFLPALGLIQPGGSFFDAVSIFASCAVAIFVINRFALPLLERRQQPTVAPRRATLRRVQR